MRLTITAVLSALLLSSCATQIGSENHSICTVGEPTCTYSGTIRNVRCVVVNEHDRLEENELGIIGGGVLGGLAGNTIGKGTGNLWTTVGGAVAGATAGALSEKQLKRQKGAEYVVELDNGDLLTVVQGGSPLLQEGQKVFVMVPSHGRSRVVGR